MDFPHPEGPTKTTNSLSYISSEKSLTASTPFEYTFFICFKTILGLLSSLRLLTISIISSKFFIGYVVLLYSLASRSPIVLNPPLVPDSIPAIASSTTNASLGFKPSISLALRKTSGCGLE